MAFAIIARLDPVPAQRRHAPAACRRLRSIEKYPAAFLGSTHLQPIESSGYGAFVKLGNDMGQPGDRIVARRPQHQPAALHRRDKRKRCQRLVEVISDTVVAAPLGGIAGEIGANIASQAERGRRTSPARSCPRSLSPVRAAPSRFRVPAAPPVHRFAGAACRDARSAGHRANWRNHTDWPVRREL